MDFGLTDQQLELKNSAHDFLKNECPPAFVRGMMADDDGMPREFYRKLAELGWTGLIVPERLGGSGLSMLDMALLLQESGYAAMPGPFLFSSTLAVAALNAGAGEELKERWLKPIAAGSAIGTVAVVEESDSLLSADLKAAASARGSTYLLSGTKLFVPYAHCADFIVVAARIESSDDVGFFVVERHSKGLSIRLMRSVDQTRRICQLKLDSVVVPASARLTGENELLEQLINVGAVAIAADSLGGSERALEMAVDYTKVREQFGKPIGSFQALQHAAAEIVADLEPARALLWYAAHAQDAIPDEAGRAASMAKARLSDIYSRTTDRAVLMHGGIGFTWEHDIHLWFKRARFNESYFGSPAFHRERLATLSGY